MRGLRIFSPNTRYPDPPSQLPAKQAVQIGFNLTASLPNCPAFESLIPSNLRRGPVTSTTYQVALFPKEETPQGGPV